MTLAEAESTTTEVVDGVIASIDAAPIVRVDDVGDEAHYCRGSDVDPDGIVRQWENLRYVSLGEGVDKLELLDSPVAAAVDAGWEVARNRETDVGEGRWVQLRWPSGDREGYGLGFISGDAGNGQNLVSVISDSPCFEVPVDER